jgi:hypothetical protein
MAERTHARVERLPDCDFCKEEGVKRPARYDFRTRRGSWANGCVRHFEQHAATRVLGEGNGQRLLLPGEDH